MEEEYWKTIPFEANYSVSTAGRVKNNDSGKVKSLRSDRNGYLRVTLYPSGKTYSIHRLVGLTWMQDSYKEGLQIDHIDADRQNNHLSNLEWVTPKENTRRIKNRPCKKGVNNEMASITEEEAYRIKYSFDKTIAEISEDLGVSREVVEHIRRRERWTHIEDSEMEKDFLAGVLKYPLGVTANLTKEEGYLLNQDILAGLHTTKELCAKYHVSKSTVCRRKRKLLSIAE